MVNRNLFTGPAKTRNQMAQHKREIATIKKSNAELLGPAIRTVKLNPKQQKVMDNLGNAYGSVTEIFNPNTNMWVKAGAGVKLVNSILPPDKRINTANAQTLGERVFSGVKIPVESKGQNVMNSSYGLSKAPNPKKISLNSGIATNAYALELMQARLDLCSPMHVTGCVLELPPSGDLYDYFTKTIAFDVQTRAQANVSFDLDIATQLSAAQIHAAYNDAIAALQIYFHYSSILSYESEPRNKNSAMTNLRQNMSSQLISDLNQLGRRLEDTPIPPRIVEWVRYMCGNFLAGNTQGAALLKIIPAPAALTTPFPDGIIAALNKLCLPANNTVYSLVRKTIPQWRTGTLYDAPVLPVYDPSFLTIFANLPHFCNDVSNDFRVPTVASTSAPVSYNSYSNRLDGAAFAMAGVFVGTTLYPGFVNPRLTAGTLQDNRLSWYTNGTIESWTKVTGNAFLALSRAESYSKPTAQTSISVHLPGADKAQGVSANTLVQTAKNFMDFIFKVDSIPVRGKLSHFNDRARMNH